MKGSIVNQIEVNRYFTKGEDPYTAIKWEERTARITNFKGEVIFEQKGVRVPESWSVTATNIVVSKYFYGKLETAERETGVDQLVRRVVKTITAAGIAQGYFDNENAEIFAHELAFLLLNQYGAFNSPVWFNVGCDQYEPNAQAGSWHWGPMYPDSTLMATVHGATGYKNPQCSACFINSVGDSMEEIMALARTEALLFKFGSGTGTNFSPLRSSKESVSGGGVASGPLSFMKGLDAFAGVIKSGGKTRRAAKMAILDIEHPDIVDFIECKLLEDKKAQALMREGYEMSFQSALQLLMPKRTVVRPFLQIGNRVLVRYGTVGPPSHEGAIERFGDLFIRDSSIIKRRGGKQVVILSGMLFGCNR
jgi:ribonucleoside-diphosphate reductase alpha chain